MCVLQLGTYNQIVFTVNSAVQSHKTNCTSYRPLTTTANMAKNKKKRISKSDSAIHEVTWTSAIHKVTWTGPPFVSFWYNSSDIAGCGATSLMNSTQSLVTTYQMLGTVDGCFAGMSEFKPYPEGREEHSDYVDVSALFVRLCTAGYIYGNLTIGGNDMNTAAIQVPAEADRAPAGVPALEPRQINIHHPICVMIDVTETTSRENFDSQTNREIEGYNTFFILVASVTNFTEEPKQFDPFHFYSVRHTTVTRLEGADEAGPFSGYLVDGGEKGAKCHFSYFMFDKTGREDLNSNLSAVFLDQEDTDGQAVSERFIAMPNIQKNEPCLWPEDKELIRKRMIVRCLDTVDDDFTDTHAGIIVHNGKEGVVHWLRRILYNC